MLTSAAALPAAAATLKPSVSARSASRVIGASDRIRAACIGVGGNGHGGLTRLVSQSKQDATVEVAAVSDIYTARKDRARESAGLPEKDVHHDYRDLLARTDVDAVFISVPDHWHAQMAIDAMAAGKDVYLQKPMTLTIEEARGVVAAAQKYGRVLQVGSQHLSDPRYRVARDLIQAGEIGTLLWAQATYSRNSQAGEWNYYVAEDASEQTIDWKRWLGPAPKRAFSKDRYFRWRKYWDYSGGIATDLFYHRLGPLLFAMGPQYPSRVAASGGIYVQKDREVPDTYSTTVEYPSFYVTLSASMANAAAGNYFPEVIYGNKGTITFEKNAVLVHPEPAHLPGSQGARRGGAAVQPKTHSTEPVDVVHLHFNGFFESMRTRKQPVLGPELGCQIMTAIKLGVDSYRTGRLITHGKPAARPGYEGNGENHPETRKRV
jgi:predicted dehydrogenase